MLELEQNISTAQIPLADKNCTEVLSISIGSTDRCLPGRILESSPGVPTCTGPSYVLEKGLRGAKLNLKFLYLTIVDRRRYF